MKIVTVVGARPQFIKAGAVSRVFQRFPQVSEFIVHTGQHYDKNMSDVFFDELDIPKPYINLAIGSGAHGEQTGRMLAAIEQALLDISPDWLLVYGDTNSTLAGALAAAKLHIPVAHVEAGLRSFNRAMPEEINRVLTDHVSTRLYAPTEGAVENLIREGVSTTSIQLVGDVMYDAYLHYANTLAFLEKDAVIEQSGYILATIHRAENTDDEHRFRRIWDAMLKLSKHAQVIWPIHPRTRRIAESHGLLGAGRDLCGLRVIDPVSYLEMIKLQQEASLIITDSGGVQKEAYFSRVPCVTLRSETEWTELVEAGWNHLLPPDDQDDLTDRLIELFNAGFGQPKPASLYGNGTAAQQIVENLIALRG